MDDLQFPFSTLSTLLVYSGLLNEKSERSEQRPQNVPPEAYGESVSPDSP